MKGFSPDRTRVRSRFPNVRSLVIAGAAAWWPIAVQAIDAAPMTTPLPVSVVVGTSSTAVPDPVLSVPDILASPLDPVPLPAPLPIVPPLRTPPLFPGASAGCQPSPYATTPPPRLLRQRADFTPYGGKTIGAVRLARVTVFDESDRREDVFLYRFLNDAHMVTRETTIRRQLLFKPGEALLPRRMEETERNLRQNGYIADARIVPLQVCGNTVNILVITRDTWSLEPGASFSHTGGNSTSGVSLTDTNFLGSGHNLSVNYTHYAMRDSLDYEIDANNVFGIRVNAKLHYADTSDGAIKNVQIERPFYSLDTRWSAGASSDEETRIDTVNTGGTQIGRFHHEKNRYEAFGGYSPGLENGFNNRYSFGVAHDDDLFSLADPTYSAIPENRTLSYPWVAFERTENRFSIYRNIDFIARTEDVPLGEHLMIRVGMGARAFDNAVPQWKFTGTWSNVPDVGPHHLLKLEGHADGGWLSDESRFENAVAGIGVTYLYLANDKNRWYGHVAVDAGSGLTEDNLLSLGGIDDLRGYPLNFQLGDRRYVATFEHRYYSSLHLFNLVHMGSVVFVDAGQAWENSRGLSVRPLYDAGVGLRFSSSKAHTGNVLHMDYAVPLKDQQTIAKAQWLLKVEKTF
ncbi:MAG TPA: hypothetical protein VFM34_04515 [Moraxellaceae bacterium]|nr:hypothetical protein [Moraxellaceae bacterium]